MSSKPLQPELLPVRRRPGYATAAVAAALGGAVGAAAVGLTAWHIASPTIPSTSMTRPASAIDAPEIALPSLAIEPPPAVSVAPIEPRFHGRAAHVVHGTAPMVSLAAGAPDEWQTGTPALIDSDDFSRTLRREVTRAVPAIHRDMVGTRAFAINAEGASCQVTLGRLAVIGKYYAEDDAPETRAQRVEAWDYTEPTLVAALDDLPESCGDPTWVILPDASSTRAPSVQMVHAKSALHNAIVARLRDEPAYKTIQTEWEADGQVGPWDTYDSTFALIGSIDDGLAIASAGITGCETVQGVVTRAWRVRDGRLGDAVPVLADVFVSKILGAADLDGDDLPEIIFEGARLQTGVLVSGDNQYRLTEGPTTLSHICPC